jgi:hypothetical protein
MGTNADGSLTIEQKTIVNKVRKASDDYRIARDTLERELREQLQNRLLQLQAVRDNEVRIAYAMGVKKATLKRAIGSKDHNTLQNILSIGGALLPENEMIVWNGVEAFTLNYVDYLGERVYGQLFCEVVYTDDTVSGFEIVGGKDDDQIRELLDRTTSANNFAVYQVIVDAIG